jgi:hypothetical protein
LDKDVLAAIIIITAVLIGLTNFFAQFVIQGFNSDPVITGAFMTIAGLVAGVKSGKDKK